MPPSLLRLLLLLLLPVITSLAQAETLRFACRGWMPIYQGSWVPVNPDPHDLDALSIEVNTATSMTSFVLTMIGRANFATKINESQIKGAIAYRRLMVDDLIEFIDFSLNRGTGELTITALEKGRRAHPLFRGRCTPVKVGF